MENYEMRSLLFRYAWTDERDYMTKDYINQRILWSFTNKILHYHQTSQQLDERLQRIKELNNNMNGLLTPKTLDTNQTTKLWSHKAINRYLELHNNRCSFWTKAWDTTIFYNHWDNNANFQSLWPTAVTRPTVKPDRFNRKRKKPLQLNLEEDTDVREGYLWEYKYPLKPSRRFPDG